LEINDQSKLQRQILPCTKGVGVAGSQTDLEAVSGLLGSDFGNIRDACL